MGRLIIENSLYKFTYAPFRGIAVLVLEMISSVNRTSAGNYIGKRRHMLEHYYNVKTENVFHVCACTNPYVDISFIGWYQCIPEAWLTTLVNRPITRYITANCVRFSDSVDIINSFD